MIIPIKSSGNVHTAGLDAHDADAIALDGDKVALRRILLERRNAMSIEQRRARDGLIQGELSKWLVQQLGTNATIALYSAFRGEVDLSEMADGWRAAGGRVLLPLVQAKNEPLVFAPYRGVAHLRVGRFGILEPQASENDWVSEPNQIAALVMPCVGWHSQGYRLGYGGGYYDRTLAQWQSKLRIPLLIGVADAWAQVTFSVETHDRRLDVLCVA